MLFALLVMSGLILSYVRENARDLEAIKQHLGIKDEEES